MARCAGLNRAAEQLNLAQPPVSKALKELEELIGCALADRSRAGARVTPEGEPFQHYSEQSTAAIRHGLRGLRGVTLGIYDEDELRAPITQFYRGKPRPDPTG